MAMLRLLSCAGIFLSPSEVPRRASACCYNFLYDSLQGRTFGAPGLTALAVNGEDEREQPRE